MDLKKLKKDSSKLTGGKASSSGKAYSKTDNLGVKSGLKVNDYNSKYNSDSNLYQDYSGSKKYNAGSWKLEGKKEIKNDNIDDVRNDKLKFLDENGDTIAMQG